MPLSSDFKHNKLSAVKRYTLLGQKFNVSPVFKFIHCTTDIWSYIISHHSCITISPYMAFSLQVCSHLLCSNLVRRKSKPCHSVRVRQHLQRGPMTFKQMQTLLWSSYFCPMLFLLA